MKLLKNILSVLLIATVAVTFAGCSDDDDNTSTDSVTGTWKAVTVALVDTEGNKSNVDFTEAQQDSITFNEDGSWSYTSLWGDITESGTGYYTDDGVGILLNNNQSTAYTRSGGKLIMHGAVDAGTYEISWNKQ